MTARVFIGGATFSAGSGGIARVARLTALALEDLDVAGVSLLDRKAVAVGELRVRSARGGRIAFATRCAAAAVTRTHFIYDSAGVARAHPHVSRLRRPCAVWIHGLEAWETLRPDRNHAIRAADLVLAPSLHTLDRHVALHGPLRATAICWLATEEDEPPPWRPERSGRPTLLLLGRMEAGEDYKGHRQVIAAWPEVVAAVPDARLLVVGGGSGIRRIRDLAAASPAAGSIEVSGFVPEEGMEAVWRRAHVLALPSRGEGFGLVYAEAMRRAIPCIASVHDAGREVNLDGVTGFNVSLDRAGDLEQRLILLLGRPDLAERFGCAAQVRWSEHFRFSRFRARFRTALASFLASGKLTP